MFAYLKNNKKGSKDIVMAQFVGDIDKINQKLPNDEVPNHAINSFIYQAMNYYYNDEGTYFNNFADSELLFETDFINQLYSIKGWLNYSNENTAKLRLQRINPTFATLYYDILPLITIKEMERIPMLKLPMVINDLDTTEKRKQEIYRNIMFSSMNNEQFLSILKGHIQIESNKKMKQKVK